MWHEQLAAGLTSVTAWLSGDGVDPVHYLASVLFGAVIVWLFSLENFNKLTVPLNTENFETTLPANYLAADERLRAAFYYYLVSLEGVYFLLCVVGSRAVNIPGYTPQEGIVWPLVAALLLTGVIPKVPWIQRLEINRRRAAHERAFIPDAVREIANQLRRANLIVPSKEDVHSLNVFGVHFEHFAESRSSKNYQWARASYIVDRLDRIRKGSVHSSVIDDEFLAIHKKELDHILSDYRHLHNHIGKLRRKRNGEENRSSVVQFESDLSAFLRRLSVFISCAARFHKQTDLQVIRAIRELGFEIEDLPEESNFLNHHAISLTVLGLFVFCGTIAGTMIVGGESDAPTEHAEIIARALDWACSALILHGTGALVASRYRDSLIPRGLWRGTPVDILKTAIRSGVIGASVLFLYFIVVHSSPVADALKLLPWGALAGLTGAFVAYYLSRDPSRLSVRRSVKEALIQGCVTGVAVYLMLNLLDAAGFIKPQLSNMAEIFRASLGFGIGLCIGGLVPREHRIKDPYDTDPYARARVQDMERRAVEHFGDEDQAGDWMVTTLPDINMSPFQAARYARTSVRVFGLMETWGATQSASAAGRRATDRVDQVIQPAESA